MLEKVFCDAGKLHSLVYRRPTFSGVLTNIERFLPMSYTHNLISTLLHRGFMICSS